MIDICLKSCAASALKAPAASSCTPLPLPKEILCNICFHRYEQMTQHVVTRQYRAPEVILCSGNYRLLPNATLNAQPARCQFATLTSLAAKQSTFGAWAAFSRSCSSCSRCDFIIYYACGCRDSRNGAQAPDQRRHTPLFNGRTCFPLSPRKHMYSSPHQFMSNRGAFLPSTSIRRSVQYAAFAYIFLQRNN
jgi:hypothetical protein